MGEGEGERTSAAATEERERKAAIVTEVREWWTSSRGSSKERD